MAKISNTTAYPNITPLASDYLVLTDTSTTADLTKTVTVQALADFIDGEVTLLEVLNASPTVSPGSADAYNSQNPWDGLINLGTNVIGVGNVTYIGLNASGPTVQDRITLTSGNIRLSDSNSDLILSGGEILADPNTDLNFTVPTAGRGYRFVPPVAGVEFQAGSAGARLAGAIFDTDGPVYIGANDPISGDISLIAGDDITISAGGLIDIDAAEPITVNSPGNITVDSGASILLEGGDEAILKSGEDTYIQTDGTANSKIVVGGPVNNTRSDGTFVQGNSALELKIFSGSSSMYIRGNGAGGADNINSVTPHNFHNEIRLGGTPSTFTTNSSSPPVSSNGTAGSPGVAGQLMASQGPGAAPQWVNVSAITPTLVVKDVTNQSGGPLVKGTAVHLDTNPSGLPRVEAADYRFDTLMPASGLVLADIPNGSDGKIVVVGLLENVSVAISGTPAVGDIVYVSTGGTLTVDRPVDATEFVQNVGIISRTAGQTDIQVTCTGRTNDLPNLTAKEIFIGSNLAGEVGKAVETNLIQVDNNSPALPNYDIQLGTGTAKTLVRGFYRVNATHPYGNNNVGLGNLALDSTSLTGENNTAIGVSALESLTTGISNVAVGTSAGDALTVGGSNVAIGVNALTTSTQGADNIAIGTRASAGSLDSIRNIAIGTEALRDLTGNTSNQNIAIGWNSADALTAGEKNVIIGAQALGVQATSSSFSTIIGESALGNANIVTGVNQTVAIGYEAGWGATDDRFVAIGYQAGRANGGAANVYIGRSSGQINTANGNTFVGSFSGAASTGGGNTLIGSSAANNLIGGTNNTVLGERTASTLTTGGDNVIIGNQANVSNPGHSEGVVIGTNASGFSTSVVIGTGSAAVSSDQIMIGPGANPAAINTPLISFGDAVGTGYGTVGHLTLQPDNAAALAAGLPVGSIYIVGVAGGAIPSPALLAIVTP